MPGALSGTACTTGVGGGAPTPSPPAASTRSGCRCCPRSLASPIWGQGLGSIMWSEAMKSGTILEVSHPHNAYLQALLDMGVLGLVLVCAFFWFVARDLIAAGPRCLAAGRDARLLPGRRGGPDRLPHRRHGRQQPDPGAGAELPLARDRRDVWSPCHPAGALTRDLQTCSVPQFRVFKARVFKARCRTSASSRRPPGRCSPATRGQAGGRRRGAAVHHRPRARARGYRVSMISLDYGQADGTVVRRRHRLQDAPARTRASRCCASCIRASPRSGAR